MIHVGGFGRTGDGEPAGTGTRLRITVWHPLNQTSGMADAGFPEQTMAPPADLAQRVASLRTARLVSGFLGCDTGQHLLPPSALPGGPAQLGPRSRKNARMSSAKSWGSPCAAK